MLDLRRLFRKPYYMVRPHLLSLLDAGIALQGLITQVMVLNSLSLYVLDLGDDHLVDQASLLL